MAGVARCMGRSSGIRSGAGRSATQDHGLTPSAASEVSILLRTSPLRHAPLGIAIAAALTLAGCGHAPARRAQRVPVVVATAERQSVPYEIAGTGTVEPLQSAQITAQVGGMVVRVPFREGDEVAKGAVLFQIDPLPYEATVARAAGVLAKDRAMEAVARVELSRAEALAPQQLIAPTELDQKRADAQSAVATVRSDSAAWVTAKLDLAHATIRAPIAGKTGNRTVNVGDYVKAEETTTPLVSINQLRPIRVRFTVPQSDLDDIRRQPQRSLVVFSAPADRDSDWSRGSLAFIDNAVDPTSGTVLLKGEFANRNGELWPGEFVRVRLRLYEQDNAIVVPTAAVTTSQTGAYCYVVKPDTTVEVRPVVVRRTWQDLSVLASGIQAGERVVTDGQIRLAPGAKASIRMAPGSGGRGGSAANGMSSTAGNLGPGNGPAGSSSVGAAHATTGGAAAGGASAAGGGGAPAGGRSGPGGSNLFGAPGTTTGTSAARSATHGAATSNATGTNTSGTAASGRAGGGAGTSGGAPGAGAPATGTSGTGTAGAPGSTTGGRGTTSGRGGTSSRGGAAQPGGSR